MAKYTEAQARAVKKYFEKNDLVKMEIRVSRAEREKIKAQAQERGFESFSSYLLSLVKEGMEAENYEQ